MNNNMVKIPKEILNEVDGLLKKSDISAHDFISYMANFYNIKSISENDIMDCADYYDSFTA